MSRRSKYKGGKKKSRGRKPNPGEKIMRPMLHLGRLDYFKYDLEQLMEASDMEDDLKPSFKAGVIARSSQRSIDDAKQYIKDVRERGDISEETFVKICRLLDRYTKVR